jgi:competence protein ComEC
MFFFLPEKIRYRLRAVQGIFIFLFLVALGAFITWQKNLQNHPQWYGNHYDSSDYIVAVVDEVPTEKAKSYKATASVSALIENETYQKYNGDILLYFSKDSLSEKLQYGDKIIFKKPLQRITNTGNPGAFNYARYCAFQQIFHQVYLKKNEWYLLDEKEGSSFREIIFKTRAYILQSLDIYISGRDESSLAEALLIGYRNNLDKDLVQAYSNIGVVHLIAISGMHLGLIYFFLTWIFARIPVIKKSKITRLVLTLFCLWFFSLLTGAPASVLRCAVMFSFIAVGSLFNKRNSIYNSLAISAFVLLCYDPFILWDVGFQLSYLAVLGIVTLQPYIYHWFVFEKRIYREIWKVASVTLAAQVFTLPVCIYYFHQFPLLFLISNMVAIPLSTIALWGCIAIVAFSPIPVVASLIGKAVWGVVWLLNHFVLLINSLPLFLWDKMLISPVETILLYIIFIALCVWLIKKNKAALLTGILSIFIFTAINAYSQWRSFRQRKIIIYNISAHAAIDFIKGNTFYFTGDSTVLQDNLLKNFNIKPAHIALRSHTESKQANLYRQKGFYQFYNCKLLVIDSSVRYNPSAEKMIVDYIVLSKNALIKIKDIDKVFTCKKYIFDASNSLWKIGQWKKECEELHLPSHTVSEQGAYVINL